MTTPASDRERQPPPCPNAVRQWEDQDQHFAVEVDGRLRTWQRITSRWVTYDDGIHDLAHARKHLAAALAETKDELARVSYNARWQAGEAMKESVAQAGLTLKRNAALREAQAALAAAQGREGALVELVKRALDGPWRLDHAKNPNTGEPYERCDACLADWKPKGRLVHAPDCSGEAARRLLKPVKPQGGDGEGAAVRVGPAECSGWNGDAEVCECERARLERDAATGEVGGDD